MVGIDCPVECGRITLALARHVVLADLVVGEGYFTRFDVLVPNKLHVVRSTRCVLVRGRDYQAQSVVEEALSVSETQVELCLVAHPVIARTGGCGDEALVG